MSLLGGLQQNSAATLGAHAFFTDAGATKPRPIPVLYEQLFDLQTQIQTQVAKLGIVTVLLTVSGKGSNPNRTKPYFEQIGIVARTYENVRINRGPVGTGQSASTVAEACGLILHGWKPAGLSAALFCTSLLLVDHPKLFVWDAVFNLQAGMTDATPIRDPLPTNHP